MITTIASVLWLIQIIIWKLIHDIKLWKAEKKVNHAKEWFLVCAGCAAPGTGFFFHTTLVWWYAIPLISAMCAWFIWLFFDGLYNLQRNFTWWYTGTNDADDAKTDNLLQKLPPWLHKLIKIGGLITFIILYIIYFKT